MEAIIPGKSLKLFSSMIKCLAKIGEELYLEAYHDKLMLKTLNSSRSAYVTFSLVPAFFESYRILNPTCNYKILLKPCLTAFKSIQTVERCAVAVYDDEPRLIIEMSCKLGVRKTYKFSVDEGSPINANYSKDDASHRLIVRPKLLEDCINNFASGVSEISLLLSRIAVRMKSIEGINEDSSDPTKKQLCTELTLDVKDFEKYELEANTEPFELVFSLRELKAILNFCEVALQPIQMFMNGPGSPIILSVKMFHLFEVDFVIATLTGSTSSSTASSQASSQSVPNRRQNTHDMETNNPDNNQSNHNFNASPVQRANRPQASSNVNFASMARVSNNHSPYNSQMSNPHNNVPSKYNTTQSQGAQTSQQSFHFETSLQPTSMHVDAGRAPQFGAVWTEDVFQTHKGYDDGNDSDAVYSDNE